MLLYLFIKNVLSVIPFNLLVSSCFVEQTGRYLLKVVFINIEYITCPNWTEISTAIYNIHVMCEAVKVSLWDVFYIQTDITKT